MQLFIKEAESMYDSEDEVMVTIDEIRDMEVIDDEVEIDLDDIGLGLDMVRQKIFEEEESGIRTRELFYDLRNALDNSDYEEAYNRAIALKRCDYSRYKGIIDNSIEQCANAGVTDAMIYMAEKFTKRGDGIPKPEAFPYLKILSDKGYIGSFMSLGDCYYHGIGCEKDLNAAKKSYFEAYMFNCSSYVWDVFRERYPRMENEDIKKDPLTYIAYELPSSKFADLIMTGKIREYAPETAYVYLKNLCGRNDELVLLKLGECLLYGLGTDNNPVVAYEILDSALDEIGDILNCYDDEDYSDEYYSKEEYKKAYEECFRLKEQAKDEMSKPTYIDYLDIYERLKYPDQILDKWENEPALFIKRTRLEAKA